tara:strand:+ start:4633 stop:5295 length:663 start_codon:yes stop_codon:yes gene_type:complete
VLSVPQKELKSQIEAVLDDFDVKAVKTGLLFSEENIRLVAQIANEGALPQLVIDPVIVDRHGELLYPPDLIRIIRQELISRALIVTPNHLEAMHLLSAEPTDDIDKICDAALELAAMGPEVVLITGGRRSADSMIDVIAHRGEIIKIESERYKTKNVRGSGDTLSAAIAASLAKGQPIAQSVQNAQRFTAAGVRGAVDWKLGSGQGPLDHLGHRGDARLD